MIDSSQGVLDAMVADALALTGGLLAETNANVSGFYHAVTSPATYDEATGDVLPPGTTTYDVHGILTGYDAREWQPDVILHTDQRYMVQRSVLPVRPHAPDTVTLIDPQTSEQTEWMIVRYQTDALGLLWLIQLRLPGEVA